MPSSARAEINDAVVALVGCLRDETLACDPADRYEDLARLLRRRSDDPPRLRPENPLRSLVHVVAGFLVVAALHFVSSPTLEIAASSALVVVWSLEALRLLGPAWNARVSHVFRHTAHPHERHLPNSGTWYVSALFLLVWSVSREAAAGGIAVLACADPAASFFGRRFGSRRLLGTKTFIGTSMFLVVGFSACLGALVVSEMPSTVALRAAGAASLVGAIAEVVSRRIDDNFTVPLAAAVAIELTLMLTRT
jgi:dolichol kinase